MPEISVVLVTFNRAKFLPRTLDSILNQTFQDFELIICDDCSTDNTGEICQEYAIRDNRIRYILREKNLGMPENLNLGLVTANCELVANLHDGDIYHPELLAKWRQALLNHPTAAFVFNKYRHLNPDGLSGLVVNNFPELIHGSDFIEFCLTDKHVECPVWGTVMCRKSVYEEMGYLDPSYSFWADFDLWFRIAERYDIAFVPEVLIDLPSKAVMPHLFKLGAWKAHAMMFRAFWNARSRHYGKSVSLGHVKQIVGFVDSRAGRVLRKIRKARQVTNRVTSQQES